MLRLFLIHLLGVFLLLSQPSRATHEEDWWNQIVQPCDSELVHHMFQICSQVTLERFKKMRESVKAVSPSPETTTSSVTKTTDTLNRIECTTTYIQKPKPTMSDIQPSFLDVQKQYQPTVKDSNSDFEKFKKRFSKRQVEAEGTVSSELEHSDLDTYFRRKRQISEKLAEDCCQIGCTRRSLSVYC